MPPKPFDWPPCRLLAEGCQGVRVDPYQECWAHLDPEDRKRALSRLRPGTPIDARGTHLTPKLLTDILVVMRRDNGLSELGDAQFDQALFSGEAVFDGAQFTGKAVFDRAQFSGKAVFDRARFSGNARFNNTRFFQRASFRGAWFLGDARFMAAQFDQDARLEEAHLKLSAYLVLSWSRAGSHWTRQSLPGTW